MAAKAFKSHEKASKTQLGMEWPPNKFTN